MPCVANLFILIAVTKEHKGTEALLNSILLMAGVIDWEYAIYILVILIKLYFSYHLHILIHRIEILCDFFWGMLTERVNLS